MSDNFFMSDTLDNFTFCYVENECKNADSTRSKDILFDDSYFLENKCFDFEETENASINGEGVLKQYTENQKQVNKLNVDIKPSDFREIMGNKTSYRKDATIKHNIYNSSKENILDYKSDRGNGDINEKREKTENKMQYDSDLCQMIIPSSRLTTYSIASSSKSNYHFDDRRTDTISSKYILNDNCKLSAWGLPDIVLKKYISRKIINMFPWQYECLNNPKVLNEFSNLIYSAPTSAGKTLVAEILALKTIFERKKKVIFILPFVSIVREKMYYFQDILDSSGIRAEGFMGSYNPPGGFSSIHFAICTIEKANSLINRLLEDCELSEIGSILVDEMHLLSDPHRGYILELLLTKVKYVSLTDKSVQIQIIGMSATLPNLDQLAKWLGAELYLTNFRPVPLYEQISIFGEIYDKHFNLVRKLEPIPNIGIDTDNILQLCLDTIKVSCSVLIFCPTKNWCENLTQQLAVAFYKIGNSGTSLGEVLKSQIKSNLILEVLEQLKFCPVGLDPILKKTVSFGIAFHHAGLTMDERDVIEGAFQSGAIKVLVATSTLSSGVNLPARRVLIRSPNFCGKPLDLLTYHQMIGRAGRMGKDTKGESILICQKTDYLIAKKLLSGMLPSVESCLEGVDKLKRAILEVIASGIASTPDDITLFIDCSLLAATQSQMKNIQDLIGESFNFLKKHEFIRFQKFEEGNEKYVATSLGKACLSASVPPDEGLALFTELEKARQCLVLETELHLIYLVTPYTACHSWGNIDWMFYLDLWDRLPSAMKRVGELVGVRESYIVNATRGNIESGNSKAYYKMMIHKRFFVALALQDLVNEVPMRDVCIKFRCNRGMLQCLQQSASNFAGMVTSFSRHLGWNSVEILLAQFQDRLQFGVSQVLLDLMRLPSLNSRLARTLYDAGIQTIIHLANYDLNTLENILYIAGPYESTKKKEGECEFHNTERIKLRKVWITGKKGLTERETAELLLRDARNYLKAEIGFKEAKWESQLELNKFLAGDSIDAKNNSCMENISINTHNEKNILNCGGDSFNENIGTQNPPIFEGTSYSSCNIICSSSRFRNNNNRMLNIVEINKTDLSQVKSPIQKPIYQTKGKELSSGLCDSLSEFSDTNGKRLHYYLELNGRKTELGFKQIEFTEMEEGKKISEVFINNSLLGLNILHSLECSSYTNISIIASDLDKSVTGESFSLQLSDESSSNKITINSFADSIDEFKTQTFFGTALCKPDAFQENKSFRSNLNAVLEDSFLEATPTKKLKIFDKVRSPFSSTIKKYSQLSLGELSLDKANFSKVHIVDVCNREPVLQKFFGELKDKSDFSFCVVCTKQLEHQPIIGENVFTHQRNLEISSGGMQYKEKKVEGFAFCWGGIESYYLSIEDLYLFKEILIVFKKVFTDNHNSVRMFDAKEQIKILNHCCNIGFCCKIEDPKVADWLLDPEGKEKSLQAMVSVFRIPLIY